MTTSGDNKEVDCNLEEFIAENEEFHRWGIRDGGGEDE